MMQKMHLGFAARGGRRGVAPKQHRKNPSAAGADTVLVKAGVGGKIEQKNEQKYFFFFRKQT